MFCRLVLRSRLYLLRPTQTVSFHVQDTCRTAPSRRFAGRNLPGLPGFTRVSPCNPATTENTNSSVHSGSDRCKASELAVFVLAVAHSGLYGAHAGLIRESPSPAPPRSLSGETTITRYPRRVQMRQPLRVLPLLFLGPATPPVQPSSHFQVATLPLPAGNVEKSAYLRGLAPTRCRYVLTCCQVQAEAIWTRTWDNHR